nr:Uma2 family endonuclease [Nitrosococcus halophilus]
MTLARDRQGGYTYGDYLTWPEEERWELIDGVAYGMAPAPSRNHQEILLELSRQRLPIFSSNDPAASIGRTLMCAYRRAMRLTSRQKPSFNLILL